MNHFAIDVRGLICLDIGASTGGFTDVLLSRGAAKVYAVDVGYGQLAWKLRNDDRVVALEKTNARYLTAKQISEPASMIVCDAGFIGAWFLFLPPYSPDLNPIEMAFAKLKALVRKAAARNYDDLWRAVGHVCDLFTEDECLNFFRAAGYEPN